MPKKLSFHLQVAPERNIILVQQNLNFMELAEIGLLEVEPPSEQDQWRDVYMSRRVGTYILQLLMIK